MFHVKHCRKSTGDSWLTPKYRENSSLEAEGSFSAKHFDFSIVYATHSSASLNQRVARQIDRHRINTRGGHDTSSESR
jgi:hypothetical protein